MVAKESQRHHGRGKGCQLFSKVPNTTEDEERKDWGQLLDQVTWRSLTTSVC